MIIKNSPFKIDVEAGKEYYWCKCGKSSNQPFCDGSHKDTDIRPVSFLAEKSETKFFCGCKKTNSQPFCDGSHNSLDIDKINNVEKKNINNDLNKINSPFKIDVEAGKEYYWCKCGKSSNQPFCDGSHKDTDIRPVSFLAEKSETKFFCGCKKTNSQPFCDGSHNTSNLELISNTEGSRSFDVNIRPDEKIIKVDINETLLTASLRNNVSHLSACGGVGKCSTCRVEIIDGLENCSKRSPLEEKLALKLKFPDQIRLACQTKISGSISYRRLLLDKRDLNHNSQITQKKLESVGTIRNLSIMFCDIKGFTPFSESLSAYDVIFILNRYFSIMREVIIKNGGEINNYIGDAILAIFGLNETRQQTLRATNAALEMINRMDEFKKYLIKAYGSDFDIRIGIHYGEVIVGSVGYGEDKKLTVIGDAVNIASRIEAINKDAGTRLLVSDDAYNEIRDNVDVQNFLRLKLRGTSNLITLHEIQRVKENSLIDHDNIKEISHDNNIWTRTLPISELEEGEKKKFISKEKEILLIKQEGIYAIENFCPHMNLPLDVGQITENGTILCPYHNSEFCFRSGEVKKWVGLKAEDAKKECEPLKIIPTLSKDSYIWVKKD